MRGYRQGMDLSAEDVRALGVALNESNIVGIEIDVEARWASVTLAVLTLPNDNDPMPSDRRVQLVLQPIGRMAASHRLGRWDDEKAEIAPVDIPDLSAVVASFGQQSIYGWEFFDVPEEQGFNRWADCLSLDWTSAEPGGRSHTVDLFQEGATRDEHIDIRFWSMSSELLGLTAKKYQWISSRVEVRDGGTRCMPGTSAQVELALFPTLLSRALPRDRGQSESRRHPGRSFVERAGSDTSPI